MINNPNNNKEIHFVNVAKTLTIFLIVLAHLPIPTPLWLFIGSFRMPLFFLLSGYLISSRQYDFISFVKKKAKTLLIPYAFFAIISLFFWYFIGKKYGNDSSPDNASSLFKYIIGFILAIPSKEYLGFNFPIWFLPSLFCAEIMFYLCQKYFRKISFFIFCLCFCIGVLIKNYIDIRLPFGIDVSFFALLFIYTGNWMKKKNLIEKYVCNVKFLYKIFFSIVFAILTIYISHINNAGGTISMVHRIFNNYFLYFVGAFSGSLFLLFLSNCIPNHRIFSFYGRNTIIILGFHLMIFSFIKAIQLFIFHIPIEIANNSFSINFLYTILTFILVTPIIFLINKYTPFLIGRQIGIL